MPVITLDTSDAAELADLLRFLHEWIDADEDHLDASLTGFADKGYNLDHLRVDLNRLTALLHNTGDGEPAF
jgi:hypothetical protein